MTRATAAESPRPGVQATPRRTVAAWIAYDVAIHGYGTMIPSVAYAIYFTSHVAVDSGRADLLWGFAVAASLVVAGLLAPLVGAAADAGGRGRALLAAVTFVCGVATGLLLTVGRGDVAAGIGLFVVAQVAAALGGSLYNAFLPQIAAGRDVARLSGIAWGVSYAGGIACFVLCLPFTRGGISEDNIALFVYTFPVTAAFLLAIGLPAIAGLPASIPRQAHLPGGTAYRRILATLKGWRRDREVPKFLLAYYLVNDGVVTVVFFTAVMMKSTFGLSVQEVLILTLLLQAIAIPSTVGFGWLGGKWSQRGAIYVTLVLWMATLALMATAQGRAGVHMIAIALGLVLGSTQSLFRSMFSAMVPADRASEYFGFHALAGRASSAIGPLLFGVVSASTGSQRWAMASLVMFFVAGGAVLWTVRVPADHGPREHTA